MMFQDRVDAGKKLALKLLSFQKENLLVLALPRGGVVVAYEIAQELGCPLNVLVVRKIGSPDNPEFGIGAISELDTVVWDVASINQQQLSFTAIESTKRIEEKELERRISKYRGGKSLPNLKNKCVILVDDGVATGVTAEAALYAVKKLTPGKIIFAVPVISTQALKKLEARADEIIYLQSDAQLSAIGSYYREFNQVSDTEVIRLLTDASDKFQKNVV
ncbi:phosphoribosyltransferase [Candidatus Microgenomates bacterium]|nr:MAG: phosphoribosyltransferase [Candidatus Microgenomates bacterium]